MNKDLGAMNPTVTALFDEATNTVTYIVADPATAKAAIVDCVLDFNPKSARTSTPFGGPADRSRAAAGPGGGVGSGDARPRRPLSAAPYRARLRTGVDRQYIREKIPIEPCRKRAGQIARSRNLEP